jgi:hypothetical protein
VALGTCRPSRPRAAACQGAQASWLAHPAKWLGHLAPGPSRGVVAGASCPRPSAGRLAPRLPLPLSILNPQSPQHPRRRSQPPIPSLLLCLCLVSCCLASSTDPTDSLPPARSRPPPHACKSPSSSHPRAPSAPESSANPSRLPANALQMDALRFQPPLSEKFPNIFLELFF